MLKGKIKISIEAGAEQGWHKYIGSDGIAIAISEFGECGSIPDLKAHFVYTKEQIVKKSMQLKKNYNSLVSFLILLLT